MCRLQFSTPPSAPDVQQPLQGPSHEGEALEALLALSADNGLDFVEEAEVPSAQQSSRYNCPFPGCKRSFAELWRLKVHYR